MYLILSRKRTKERAKDLAKRVIKEEIQILKRKGWTNLLKGTVKVPTMGMSIASPTHPMMKVQKTGRTGTKRPKMRATTLTTTVKIQGIESVGKRNR